MKSREHHVTAPEDRVPVAQKIAYGMGGVVTIMALNAVQILTGLVYVAGLGVSAIWIGWAQAFPRLWDAVIDPFIGNVSDNSRSRFGRRIPFLVIGGVLIGAAFALLWMVPREWSKTAMFGYFVVASLLFYTVVPLFAIPWGALGMEMSADYHERTKVFAYASFIGNVFAISTGYIYWLANLKIFGGDPVVGVKWVGLGMGVVLMGVALWCAFVCREGKLKQASTQQRVPIVQSFKDTYRNRTFLRLVAAFVLLIVAFQLVMGFSNFITIFYLYAGNTARASSLMAINGALWSVIALAGAFLMTWLSRRLGKRIAVLIGFGLIIGGNLTKIVCYDPHYPYLTMIPTAAISLGMVICFSLVNAMIADVCDEDELATGMRREGIYFAVYNWWWKVAMSIATVLSGYLLRLTGFIEGAPTESAATMFWVRAWEIGLPPLLCLVGAALLVKYPLTEQRAYEVKRLLDLRKTSGAAVTPGGLPGTGGATTLTDPAL